MKKFLLILLIMATITVSAQVKIGNNVTTIDPSSLFELESTTQGLLIPRMTTAQITAIASPATGMQVFNSTTNCLQINEGTPGTPTWNCVGKTAAAATAWQTTGNTGTTAGTNFIGTTDGADLVIKTNNTEKVRVLTTGEVGIGKTPASGSYIDNAQNFVSAGPGARGANYAANMPGTTAGSFLKMARVGYQIWDLLSPVSSPDLSISEYGTSAIYFKSGGNVGIGTTTPTNKLDVYTNGLNQVQFTAENNGNRVTQKNAGTAQYNQYIFKSSEGTNAVPTALGSGYDIGYTLYQGYGNTAFKNTAGIRVRNPSAITDTSSPGDLIFETTPTGSTTLVSRITIKDSGNVGIGTTAPTNTLDVNGTARIRTTAAGASTDSVLTVDGTGVVNAVSQTALSAAAEPWYNTATSTAATANTQNIYQTGNVGVGIPSSTYRLDIGGTASPANRKMAINGTQMLYLPDPTTFDRSFFIGSGGSSLSAVGGGGGFNFGVGLTALNAVTTGVGNTALGLQALYNTTTGGNNLAIGLNVLFTNTTGSNNLSIGYWSNFANTTGNNNLGIGTYTLYNSKTGNNGVAIGSNSQQYANDTTTAWDNTNTSVGYQSLQGSSTPANNTGLGNTAIGRDAMFNNTTGSNNIGMGYQTMYNNTTGSSNYGFGYAALYTNTTGIRNTAIGQAALYKNLSGGQNIAIGHNTLFTNSVGSNNIGIGNGSLQNTTSNDNTAVGHSALFTNTTGASNTSEGGSALYFSKTGSNGVAIGYSSQFYANDTATAWDNTNTSVGTNSLRGSNVAANNTGLYNTALGRDAMVLNTSGSNNIAIGYQSLYNNSTGTNNVASGLFSLTNNTTGTTNVSSGSNSMYTNTTGSNNVASGFFALNVNSTGNTNTAIGTQALRKNDTGSSNVALGYQALISSVSGSNGVAIGTYSQYYANDTASAYDNTNTSVGTNSLKGSTTAANNTGISNTAIGRESMFNNTSGSNNIGLGYNALYNNTTGSFNAALGLSAMFKNTTGDYNTTSGNFSLYNNTTGTRNTASGYGALTSTKAGGYGVAIGFYSQYYINDTATTWDNTNTSVGAYSLQGSAIAANNTGISNTALGRSAMAANTSGSSNVAVGYQSMVNNTTASNSTAVGIQSGADQTTGVGNTYLGYNTGRGIYTGNYNTILGGNVTGLAAGLSSNIILADGAGNQRINVDATGNTGIGTGLTPTNTLDVNGTARIRTLAAGASTDTVLTADATGVVRTLSIATVASGIEPWYNVATNSGANANTQNIYQMGNVGVGTTTPSAKLQVVGDSSGNAINITPASGQYGMSLTTVTTAGQSFGGLITAGTNSSDTSFHVRNAGGTTSYLYVRGDGNVGIGNIAPTEKLQVSGNIKFLSQGYNVMTDTGNSAFGEIYSASDTFIGNYVKANGATSSLVKTDAGLGSMITMQVTDGIRFHTNLSGAVGTTVGRTTGEVMRIAHNGNVGIGTTTPIVKLQVNGEIQAAAQAPGQGLKVLGRASDDFTWAPLVFNNAGTIYNGGIAFTPTYASMNVGSGLAEIMRWLPNGNVGVGTTAPAGKLEIKNALGSFVVDNSGVSQARFINGNYGSMIRNDSNYTYFMLTNSGDQYGGWNSLRPITINNTNGHVYLAQTGNVGIGTNAPTRKLDVVGDAIINSVLGGRENAFGNFHLDANGGGMYLNWFSGNGVNVGNGAAGYGYINADTFYSTSDRRLKTNITKIENGLNTISLLNPVSYDKKGSIKATDYNTHETGFIAQEVQKILPYLVSETKTEDKTLGVNYIAIIPILTKAMQEQQAQIEAQKAQLEAQQKQIDELKALILKK
jgi:trimeric autotransporter adhesin